MIEEMNEALEFLGEEYGQHLADCENNIDAFYDEVLSVKERLQNLLTDILDLLDTIKSYLEVLTIFISNFLQVLLYVLASIFTVLGIWLIAFKKTKRNTKIIYAVIFFIWLVSPRILPSVMRQFDFDTCVDIGICAEGLRFSNGIMNKEYCLKEGQKWDDKEKMCDMRIEMRTCEKQGYEWIYPEDKCSHEIIRNW